MLMVTFLKSFVTLSIPSCLIYLFSQFYYLSEPIYRHSLIVILWRKRAITFPKVAVASRIACAFTYFLPEENLQKPLSYLPWSRSGSFLNLEWWQAAALQFHSSNLFHHIITPEEFEVRIELGGFCIPHVCPRHLPPPLSEGSEPPCWLYHYNLTLDLRDYVGALRPKKPKELQKLRGRSQQG